MNVPILLAAAANSKQGELPYIWDQATPEGKAVIVVLVLFSILAWTVMIGKALQMRRAKRLNKFFDKEFHTQKNVLDVFDRRGQGGGGSPFFGFSGGRGGQGKRLQDAAGEESKKIFSF